jgi:hypothetical protein
VVIPYEKSLLFRTKSYRNSPEGVSLLRTAYRAWFFKKKIEEIEGIGIERDLAGLPVIYVPEDVDIWDPDNPKAVALKAYLEKLVSNIRRDKNEGALLPANYELKLLSTGSARQFDTNKIIERYDMRIAMSVLADLILMGHTNSGSFALAKEKKNLLAASLEAMADNISNIINTRAIPKLLELNTFTNYTKYPTLERGEIETPNMSELADAMDKFKQQGMPFFPHESTENYIRECLGLPRMTEEEHKKLEAIMEEEKNELKEQMNQNSNNQNSNSQSNGKKLPPRKTKEHETDDKGEFNNTYEEAGMKKFFKAMKQFFIGGGNNADNGM